MKRSIIVCLGILSVLTAKTNDRLFTYTYQTNVLNRGQKEIEVWTTLHAKKADFYRGIKNRMEFEVGLGKKTQAAFYINTSLDAMAVPNGADVELQKEFDISFSNEWKHQFTDPVANKLGSAIYGEFTLGLNEIELETKLLLDKQVNNWTVAFNMITEYEIEKEFEYENGDIETEREHAFKLEFNAAFAYTFKKGIAIGMETVQKNEITRGDKLKYCAWFAGPAISYTMDRFWIAASVMPQMIAFKNRSEGTVLDLDEYERLQARLIFSFAF